MATRYEIFQYGKVVSIRRIVRRVERGEDVGLGNGAADGLVEEAGTRRVWRPLRLSLERHRNDGAAEDEISPSLGSSVRT